MLLLDESVIGVWYMSVYLDIYLVRYRSIIIYLFVFWDVLRCLPLIWLFLLFLEFALCLGALDGSFYFPGITWLVKGSGSLKL